MFHEATLEKMKHNVQWNIFGSPQNSCLPLLVKLQHPLPNSEKFELQMFANNILWNGWCWFLFDQYHHGKNYHCLQLCHPYENYMSFLTNLKAKCTCHFLVIELIFVIGRNCSEKDIFWLFWTLGFWV